MKHFKYRHKEASEEWSLGVFQQTGPKRLLLVATFMALMFLQIYTIYRDLFYILGDRFCYCRSP